MMGAISQKVPGLQLVKWRLMKASYGLVLEPIFVPGEHDEKRKFQDKVDGNIRCRDVMRWCAVLVIIGNLTGMLTARVQKLKMNIRFDIPSSNITQGGNIGYAENYH
jgi:hypothetical protein